MVTKQRNFEMEWVKMHLDTLDAQFAALMSKSEPLLSRNRGGCGARIVQYYG